ncbi:LTA synthase family protein [Anaerobranca gottschalkii]|uniref:Sulfatase n=1 Tax=Anaerobranca gottschalkii DSM 13577 TaxID=1120990 RepID=A0A1I0B6U1_9FIRM|nr:alkaline phosphatase family protein [Anaerobranca gottschalkii]SET02490.1 Sulfatase [Anaerobranca gottschalkii DSM 13577]
MKPFKTLFYLIFSLFTMEFILRITTVKSILSYGFFISLLFNLSFATAFFLILNFFSKKFLKHAVAVIFLVVLAIIYSSQIIYYQFFRTFYHLYSASNAGQVSDFWKDILLVTGKNLQWVILVFTPALILFFLGKKIISSKTIKYNLKFLLVLLIILTHLSGVLAVYKGGRYTNSPYDLYFKNSNPLLSVQNLGLLTTIRLDLQRMITNWTPVVDVFIPDPVDTGDDDPDDNDEPKEREYNVLNIDFDYLIEKEKDETIRLMHEYFKNLQPTAKNEYTGIFQGYNLILITAESLAPFAINKEITPTLYKLVHEGFYFPNFYVPLWDVSTSDGEYMGLTSLIPKSGVWSFRASSNISLPFVMGNQLKNLGYKTVAYHNHTYTYYGRHLSHPNMGYDYKGIGNGLDVKRVWPASDLEMMEVTVDEYINNEPFHAYYMTVSGHLQYNFIGNNMAMKNRKLVEHLPLSTQAKAYLATQIELDKALEYLLERLEEAGIAERTLIVMSTDHYPYGLEHDTIDELSGFYVDRDFDIHKSPLVMYVKGMEPKRIDDPAWGIDIIPTISNLMGLEFDSRLLMGRDIFSDSEPLVFFRNMSFITDKGRYNARTRKFIPNEEVEVDDDYVERISRIIQNKFYFSRLILENDYYSKVLNGIR